MTLRLLGDLVALKVIEEASLTKGGLIIPDMAKEKPTRAEVMGVGPGIWQSLGRELPSVRIPLTVEVGDIVLFGKWSGTEAEIDGVKYLIMREADLWGVLDGAAKFQTMKDTRAEGAADILGNLYGGEYSGEYTGEPEEL